MDEDVVAGRRLGAAVVSVTEALYGSPPTETVSLARDGEGCLIDRTKHSHRRRDPRREAPYRRRRSPVPAITDGPMATHRWDSACGMSRRTSSLPLFKAPHMWPLDMHPVTPPGD